MKYIKDIIPISSSKRPGIKSKKIGFTIHSTGNTKSTARNERDYLTNSNNNGYASFNFVVDDKECIECVPWNEVSYHAGNRTGNWQTIGIEMCESGDRKKVISNTIDLIIKIYKSYKVPLNLYRHYDWPMTENGYTYRKNCPRILNYNKWQGWVEFKTLLQNKLEESNMNEKKVKEIVKNEYEKLNKEYKNQNIPKWSEESIKFVKEKKIMIGDAESKFNPNKPVTRAELAQVIKNIYDIYS